MQTTQQPLMQSKVKGIALKAIISMICSILSFIPYLGIVLNLASWILFFVVLYELKIYGGAKNLFTNFFISIAIYWSIMLIGTQIIPFMKEDLFLSFLYSEKDFLSVLRKVVSLVIIISFLAVSLSYKFIKAFFYELARVSKQKYFIYAFWTFLIGLYTLFLFGLGALFILASAVLQFIAWINFKEFAKEDDEELQNQTSNFFAYFNLKLIKILMIASFVLGLIIVLYSKSIDFIISYYPYIWNTGNFKGYSLAFSIVFSYYSSAIIFILGLIAIILLCEKLKSYKILIFFILWRIVNMFDYIYNIFVDYVLVDSFAFFSLLQGILLIVFSFFFFRALVKETNNKLFFAVFLSYVLVLFIPMSQNIILIFFRSLDLSTMGNTPYFANFLFLVVYNILAIVAWSRFKLKINQNQLSF